MRGSHSRPAPARRAACRRRLHRSRAAARGRGVRARPRRRGAAGCARVRDVGAQPASRRRALERPGAEIPGTHPTHAALPRGPARGADAAGAAGLAPRLCRPGAHDAGAEGVGRRHATRRPARRACPKSSRRGLGPRSIWGETGTGAEAMKFGYTIVYVDEVEATIAFYEKAFGLKRGMVAGGEFGELATGDTKLGFAAKKMLHGTGVFGSPDRKVLGGAL